MVKVSGTQALFQEPSTGSEGPTPRDNGFLTPRTPSFGTCQEASRRAAVASSQPTARGLDDCPR